ncbi:hypothetical protein G9A89_021495 [Geosiphon pyriformis]|nr:hypothetical protein G9A89_021495 [Geosiphon pyriformis]
MPVKTKKNYKHQQIELPTNSSYHYIPGSAINIISTGTSTSNTTSTFGHFSFQSKQKKEDLLGPYNFGTASLWEVTDSEEEQEEEKEKSEDQEFTYQNPIPKNLNIETLNFQTQQNPNLKNPEIETPNFQMQHHQNNHNSDINNQQHLPPVIMINSAPPIDKQQQQLLQPSQQP